MTELLAGFREKSARYLAVLANQRGLPDLVNVAAKCLSEET